MTDVEVFVWEFGSIDRKSTSAVMAGEISSLRHKILDYAMERAAFVCVLIFIVTSAQRSEILSCFGDVICIKLQVL